MRWQWWQRHQHHHQKSDYFTLQLKIGNIQWSHCIQPLQTNLLKTIKYSKVFANDFRFALLCVRIHFHPFKDQDQEQNRKNPKKYFFSTIFSSISSFVFLLPLIFSSFLLHCTNIVCFYLLPRLFLTLWFGISFFLSSHYIYSFVFFFYSVPNVNCFSAVFFFKQWSTHIKYAKH